MGYEHTLGVTYTRAIIRQGQRQKHIPNGNCAIWQLTLMLKLFQRSLKKFANFQLGGDEILFFSLPSVDCFGVDCGGKVNESPVNKLLAYNYDERCQQITVDHLARLRPIIINFYESSNDSEQKAPNIHDVPRKNR